MSLRGGTREVPREGMEDLIFVDTNILYHILHKTPRTEKALTIPEENPGNYAVDMVVHNEILYASTRQYLERRHRVKGTYSARKWIKKHGYPKEVINVVRELFKRLNIRLISSIHTEQELYKALMSILLEFLDEFDYRIILCECLSAPGLSKEHCIE